MTGVQTCALPISPNFRAMYDVADAEFDGIISDDIERLKFGYRLLMQVLFGEESIKLKEGAFDQRMNERKEILEARRQADIQAHQDKAPFEKYIED